MTARAFVDPRTVLSRHGLRPKRSFGQNFLVAHAIVERIAAACVPDDEVGLATVVEIGAGLGTLTSALVARSAHVVAIERDRDLVPVLREELAADLEASALTIEEADAATFDLASPFAATAGPCVLAGNLPYQITGRLIERAGDLHRALRREGRTLSRAVFMVQREVGDRLIASPSSGAWGQLSVFVQATFSCKRVTHASAGCFYPAPEIDSTVIALTPLDPPRAEETPAFRAVVHAAFGTRRKTLKNALRSTVPNDAAWRAIEATKIDLGRRGETLTIEELAQIGRAIDGT